MRELQAVPASLPAGVTCHTQNHFFLGVLSLIPLSLLFCVCESAFCQEQMQRGAHVCGVCASLVKCRVKFRVGQEFMQTGPSSGPGPS
jgi:hypothetical protein